METLLNLNNNLFGLHITGAWPFGAIESMLCGTK